jgi:hypothetical protein
MKLAIALSASLMLASTSSFADTGPLPPGKPAGTRAAQASEESTLYLLAGLAILGIIIGVAASTGASAPDTGPMVTPH